MHLPNTLTDVDVLAQGKEALRSAEFVRKIFCMVAGDGCERDRDSTEEEPDYGDQEEPIGPTAIVGAEEPSGPEEPAGSGGAAETAQEEAAGKAAEEEAAKKAAEEAAAKAAEEEAAKKAAEEAAAKAAKEEPEGEPSQGVAAQEAEGEIREEPRSLVLRVTPREPPYPVAKDSQGREYTYQEVRAVPKEKVPKPRSSKRPPEPKEGPKKKKPKEEEPEKPEEGGKGKKGKGKGRGFRVRSEEAFQRRKLKGLNKLVSDYEERGEELPERVQQLLATFGPGGVSSGSRDRPSVATKPAYVPRFVLKEAPKPEAEATSDIPEPDPAVEDQRRVRVGQLTTPKKSEDKPVGGIRLRSRSGTRLHRESGRQLSNYRRRLSEAREAVAKAKARGSVRASIRQGVYKKEGLEEACSSCDDRVKKQQEVIREFASRRIAERRAKATAEERPTKTKERKERTKEERKEDKNLPVIVAGRQRGESLEREVRAETYEYLRTRKKSEAAPKAEVEKKEEKKKEGKEQKEKEEEKKVERKPWILTAVEKAEAAERAEAAAKPKSIHTTLKFPRRRRQKKKKRKKIQSARLEHHTSSKKWILSKYRRWQMPSSSCRRE